ncbi:hypothetical protein B0H14DRAFT_2769462 [Mycena olivaceomarginata]|nr:hypothetical protein B0H14DRAFT_2769462 [Mycena olivaceomarginata]
MQFIYVVEEVSAPILSFDLCAIQSWPAPTPYFAYSFLPAGQMQYIVDSDQFAASWNFMIRLFSQTAVLILVYGVYVTLFLLSIYILARRRAPRAKLLIAVSCTMALFGTAQIAIAVATAVVDARFFEQVVHVQVLDQPDSLSALLTVQNVLFLLNNFVTDSFFLYRCYVIWDYHKRVLILPVLLMLSTFTVAMVECGSSTAICKVTDAQIAFALVVATNLVLTIWKSRTFYVGLYRPHRTIGRILSRGLCRLYRTG